MYTKRSQKASYKLLSVIIIAKNEEKKLPECLESVKWADEIILVDTDSTDKTVDIAKANGANVFYYEDGSYQDWRNRGLKEAKGKWILYIDADERILSALRDEILKQVKDDSISYAAYAIPRKNIILGREMRHGGQWPDYQKRLFKRKALKEWKGDLHEQPVIEGELGYLHEPMIHIKHDNLSEMVIKTNRWSTIEAKILLESNHPQMVPWRFVRIMVTELWLRLVKQKGMLDGVAGVIYAIYQMWSRFITYGKLWEMQINQELKIRKLGK